MRETVLYIFGKINNMRLKMKKILTFTLLAVTLQIQASPSGFDINVAKESDSDLFKNYIYVIECSTTEFQQQKWKPPSIGDGEPLDSRILGTVDFKLYGAWRSGSVHVPTLNIFDYEFDVNRDFLPAEQYFHFDGRNVLEDHILSESSISVSSIKGDVNTNININRNLRRTSQLGSYEFAVYTLRYGYDEDDEIKPVIIEPAVDVGDTLASLTVYPSTIFNDNGSALASCSTYRLTKYEPPSEDNGTNTDDDSSGSGSMSFLFLLLPLIRRLKKWF